MLAGDFERAWQETDKTEAARRRNPNPPVLARHLRRVWSRDPLMDRRVLVRCYHGLGDTIQFIRYIPILRKCAAHVMVQCQASLAPLLLSIVHRDELMVLDRDPDPAFDTEIELMELAYAFRTTLGAIPREVPYLRLTPEDLQRSRHVSDLAGLKVGVVWSSGNWNILRNTSLADLAPLTLIPGVTFVSLQLADAGSEITDRQNVIQFSYALEESASIIDTAGVILNLDLILSVDTMVAHLAGALGKPVWTLLPFCADWRWMMDRSDSPWYPTMRLFRQPRAGDWHTVIEDVARNLSEIAAASCRVQSAHV